MIGAFFAKLAAGAVFKRAGAFLGAIPRWVWIGLGIALLVFLAVRWHGHKVDAAYEQGRKDKDAELAAKAVALKQRVEALTAKTVATIRMKADEQVRYINLAADRERLLGPGKAAVRCPTLPGSSGGHDAQPRSSDNAGDRLPAHDRFADGAVVPWGWLVSHAQTCDINRNEVVAWREWYDKMNALWPK